MEVKITEDHTEGRMRYALFNGHLFAVAQCPSCKLWANGGGTVTKGPALPEHYRCWICFYPTVVEANPKDDVAALFRNDIESPLHCYFEDEALTKRVYPKRPWAL